MIPIQFQTSRQSRQASRCIPDTLAFPFWIRDTSSKTFSASSSDSISDREARRLRRCLMIDFSSSNRWTRRTIKLETKSKRAPSSIDEIECVVNHWQTKVIDVHRQYARRRLLSMTSLSLARARLIDTSNERREHLESMAPRCDSIELDLIVFSSCLDDSCR